MYVFIIEVEQYNLAHIFVAFIMQWCKYRCIIEIASLKQGVGGWQFWFWW
jgi:hypothetical protein